MMARHVAAHLQVLMLFTIRLAALHGADNQTNTQDDANSASVDPGDSHDALSAKSTLKTLEGSVHSGDFEIPDADDEVPENSDIPQEQLVVPDAVVDSEQQSSWSSTSRATSLISDAWEQDEQSGGHDAAQQDVAYTGAWQAQEALLQMRSRVTQEVASTPFAPVSPSPASWTSLPGLSSKPMEEEGWEGDNEAPWRPSILSAKSSGRDREATEQHPEKDAADDDEDEDQAEAGRFEDPKPTEASHKITPNFDGFQQQVIILNPLLATTNKYLADRIARQQCLRYLSLLSCRVRHIEDVAKGTCLSRDMCIKRGSSIIVGRVAPTEAVERRLFPPDVPLPPAGSLPATFECQLCFKVQQVKDSSDWKHHVHSDVQAYDCTWETCRNLIMFRRKADWVRHENEAHRRLEWWTCDVDDCRHTCYRRDNFVQHLVREHKFPEPEDGAEAAGLSRAARAGNRAAKKRPSAAQIQRGQGRSSAINKPLLAPNRSPAGSAATYSRRGRR